jgi:urocanate hydratase
MITNGEKSVLTLVAIDAMFPDQHVGSVFSDLHKDVYGYRPRGITFTDMAEFDAEYARLQVQLEKNMAEEEAQDKIALAAWEEEILKTIDMGANTRDVAIRWLMDKTADEFEGMDPQDVEHFYWKKDISFKDIKRLMLEDHNMKAMW